MRQLLLVGALCLGGCTTADEIATEPPAGYPQAYAMNDCAPWDGPAIAILLTAQATDSLDAFPMVRLMIYPRGEEVAGRTYRWPEQPEVAVGTRCDTADDCVMATSGEITLTQVRTDSAMGRARLVFPGGEEIAGGFRAVWLQRRILCG